MCGQVVCEARSVRVSCVCGQVVCEERSVRVSCVCVCE